MRWPITLRSDRRITVFPNMGGERWITGRVLEGEGLLESKVQRDGSAKLRWLLDADGLYCELTPIGLAPRTLAQALGLTRRVERYKMGPPLRLTAKELLLRLEGLEDEELPMARDLRRQVKKLPADSEWTRDEMRTYLGE